LKQKILVKGITIESCGLDVDQGIFSPAVAVRIAKEFDLSLDSHRAKSLASCDIHRADLILPMELQQYICLITMFPDKKQKIKLLRDFAPWPVRLFCNINDPYGSDENEFRHCFRQMQKALEGLINFLAIDNNLRTE
jgi:protein-tyrosine-phosphatase